jgi:hypothetical protein
MELLIEVSSVYGSNRVGFILCLTTQAEPTNEAVENAHHVYQSYVPPLQSRSSICLSRDRSIASSKLSSPKSAILSFLLQLPVPYSERLIFTPTQKSIGEQTNFKYSNF